jgi:CRISPR/Cas system-associated protein Cas7 (RAMP superfamily)
MHKFQVNNKVLFYLLFVFVILVIFSSIIVFPNRAIAAEKYTIDAKINLKNLNNPQKLKVVAYSNGK